MNQYQGKKGITSDEEEDKGNIKSLEILNIMESKRLYANPIILWYSPPTKYKGGGK